VNGLELKIPPVALALVFAGAMWIASTYLPFLSATLPGRLAISVALAVAGVVFAGAGVLAFRRARTTVNPITPGNASSLVTSGVYRMSRNPMYVGLLLLLAGWAVYLSHVLAFLLLPAFVAGMTRFQIVPEERILSARFGDSFLAYTRSVRRWL
jgi:protein-S-isoprenylcysteine O-methyltransferase Ste14